MPSIPVSNVEILWLVEQALPEVPPMASPETTLQKGCSAEVGSSPILKPVANCSTQSIPKAPNATASKNLNSGRSKTERLWQEYFKDPSQWWDIRKRKTNQRAPDFKHKITEDSLWIDGWYNPGWVKDMLEEKESGSGQAGLMDIICSSKASVKSGAQVNASKEQDLRDNSRLEVLSLEEALTSLEGMPQRPSVENFMCLLQKCRKEKNLTYAKRLHAYMCKIGLETHRSLGNYLVPMLADCGSMCDAQQVFNGLADPNEYSWTSLITGYVERGESQQALELYQKMQEVCVHPSKHTLVTLLKACARAKDVERGREIHAEISRKGLEKDPFIGSTLVDMYAKCGSLAIAREVLDKLPIRNGVSWTALIAGYAEHGLGAEALNCFEMMHLEGVSPDAVTYVCTLKACGSIEAIDKGQKIHAEIDRKGLERDLVVGNTLVDMYAKCGLLAKAREVFDQLPIRDVVSWNVLIAGYAERRLGEEVLNCFENMQLEGVSPNAVTFVCSLKACGSIGATDKGGEIHAEVARKGLERDLLVGNTLVDMYAKCSLLAKAREVFDKLSARDVVSWTALIAGYAEHGLGEEALDCFEQMQLKGVSPDAVTYVSSLKACDSIRAIDKGQEIHADIAKKGLDRDPCVGNMLVDMYARCGSFMKAQEVFDKLPVRDIVSWSALIAGYAEQGLGEEALSCFERMQGEGVSSDAVTFVSSLKACASIGAIDKGDTLHAQIAIMGLERDPFVGNTLVDMYAKCGSLAKAQEVFDKLLARNVVSWNALIGGYAEHRFGDEALKCFEQMQEEGVSPDSVTFVCSLKACGNIGVINKGLEIHAEIVRKGLERDPFVGSTLVDVYAKCRLLAEARDLFDKLSVRDVVSWSALIAGYAEHGLGEETLDCFKQMQIEGVSPDIVSWNALIAAYAQLGESEIVFDMFERMLEGIQPDEATFLSVLTVCSHTGQVDMGQKYFDAMSKDYGITPTLEHHTCMIDLLCRAGQLDKAVTMVQKMPFEPDLTVWLIVLGACQKWGNVELGRQAFEHAVRLDEKVAAAYVMMSNIYADAHMLNG